MGGIRTQARELSVSCRVDSLTAELHDAKQTRSEELSQLEAALQLKDDELVRRRPPRPPPTHAYECETAGAS